jgi:hypothetical protein
MNDNKIQRFSSPKNISGDTTQFPKSFDSWRQSNTGILPNKSEKLYEQYLIEWYENNTSSSSNDVVRDNYIQLIQRLSVYFKDDTDFRKLTDLDLSNDQSLSIIIPVVVDKLKQIAKYYNKKRNAIKDAKLKYSMTGSGNAIDKIFTSYFLSFFTKSGESYTLKPADKELFLNYPELSAIGDTLTIEVEELYDSSPENFVGETVSDYSENPLFYALERSMIDITDEDTQEVFPSALINPFETFVDAKVLRDYLELPAQEYLGLDLMYLSGGADNFDSFEVTLELQKDNNYFYFYSGEFPYESPYQKYPSVQKNIHDFDWSSATSGATYQESDVVFVEKEGKIEGAWFSKTSEYVIEDNMIATIYDGRNLLFPFAGFGLSSEDIEWTGRQITDEFEFQRTFFPSERSFSDNKDALLDLYWGNDVESISSAGSIHLQDTTLVDDGAYASVHYKDADKVWTRLNTQDGVRDINPNGVFNGIIEGAWLFDFKNTDFVVDAGQNNWYYPIKKYTDFAEITFKYDGAESQELADVDIKYFTGSIAGTTPETADKFFVLDTCSGSVEDALEGAWLKGFPLSAFSPDGLCSCEDENIIYSRDKFTDGSTQSSLYFKVEAGDKKPFVWLGGEGNINNFTGFTGYSHDNTCEYKKLPQLQKPDFLKSNGFFDDNSADQNWNKCTCKAVNYTPLGHDGDTLIDNNGYTDIIIKNTSNLKNLNLKTWVGSDGKDYKTSKDAAWFKTTPIEEKSVGWAKGRWVTGDNSEFTLEFGQEYFYFRNNMEECSITKPYLIVKQSYCDLDFVKNCEILDWKPEWRKLIQDENGQWVDGGVITDMNLDSSKFYQYQHQSTNKYKKGFYRIADNKKTEPFNIPADDYINVDNTQFAFVERERDIEGLSFIINIPINAEPYWGAASFENDPMTKFKGISHNGRTAEPISDYLFTTNPNPSEIILTNASYFEYKRSECAETPCFVWTQPLTFTVEDEKIEWKKLQINRCVESDILDHITSKDSCVVEDNEQIICLDDNDCGCIYKKERGELFDILPTSERSDLVFYTNWLDEPVFVNYFARAPFNLVFDVSSGNVSDRPYEIGNYITAKYPWRNLFNTRDTTIQYDYNSINLKPQSYFGITVNNQKPTRFNITYPINVINVLEGVHIYREGYDDSVNTLKSFDASYMKHKNGSIAGKLNTADQDFSPYLSKYEIDKRSMFPYDPNRPKSPYNDAGEVIAGVGVNFRKEYTTYCGDNSWYSKIVFEDNDNAYLSKVTQDINGIEYAMFYNNSPLLNYVPHTVYYKHNGIISQLNFSDIFAFINFNGDFVMEFDIFYDTIVIKNEEMIVISKITIIDDEIFFNPESTKSYSIPNGGDYWFDESSNTILIFKMHDTPVHGIVHEYDIASNKSTIIYSPRETTWLFNQSEWELLSGESYADKSTHKITKNADGIVVIAITGDNKTVLSHFKRSLGRNLEMVKFLVINESIDNELHHLSSYKNKDMLMVWNSAPPYELEIKTITH